jgi:vesicle coat complex subunit
MNVNGKYAMIFHNEHNGVTYYSLSDSTKQQDGTYANKSYSARFTKGTTPPTNESKITFKGFTSNRKADNDKVYTTIQVMEWEYSEQDNAQYQSNSLDDETLELVKKFKEKNKVEKVDPFFASSNIEVDDDDLPF